MEYLFIAFAVLFTSLGQLMQKLVADRHLGDAASASGILPLMLKLETVLAVLFLAMGMGFWLATLTTMEVSKAFPFLSSGYIVVMLFAKLVFKESIPIHRWLGVILICLGLSLIAQT